VLIESESRAAVEPMTDDVIAPPPVPPVSP
jgi:hypothetical protein